MIDNSDEINEECEQDTQVVGYYTRSKRRRLNQNEEELDFEHKESTERKRKNPITFLPLELLTDIMKKISYDELGMSRINIV